MLTLEWEPLDRLLADGVEDLLAAHWEEVALNHAEIPLAPDWAKARTFEKQGVLKTAAMRRDGRLIGYDAFFVTPHIHYRHTIHAVNDIIYVDPEERGSTGIRLIRGCEDMLRELGVVKVIYHTKLHVTSRGGTATVGDLLGRLGYKHIENVYAKLL